MKRSKRDVVDYWNAESCGEIYAAGDSLSAQMATQARTRYELEPYLPRLADFGAAEGKAVLEIGVGMGADHARFSDASPSRLVGVDITYRAIEWTRARLGAAGARHELTLADAEHLPFRANEFDIVYSWGVLHHSPDTRQAIREAWRVLKPGGCARIMVYHKYSVVGYLLWIRYALMRAQIGLSLGDIYAAHLESPGTKAFSVSEARDMFSCFQRVTVHTQLSFGDLLEGGAGRSHDGTLVRCARRLWPRTLIRWFFARHGLLLFVVAEKTEFGGDRDFPT